MRTTFVFACAFALLTGCAKTPTSVVHPAPLVGSQPVPVNEVQSAVFWVHPTDTSKSLLLITNEHRGLEVHDPGGRLLKHLDDGLCPQYVDVLYDFDLGGKKTDLVLASSRGADSPGVHVWRVDPEKRKLYELNGNAAISAFDGVAPLGLCTYRSRHSGKSYFFVTLRDGSIEQWELKAVDAENVTANCVRQLKLGGETKSCIADDETGAVYIAEDDIGIRRYDAEPAGGSEGTLVIRAGEHGLLPNLKGPAIYGAADGRGYLLVVGQGSKLGHAIVNVYERGGDYRYVLTIDPAAGTLGPIDHSSGLAICNQPLGPLFPAGALAINDQLNPNASEDFKLYSWLDIAREGKLIIDMKWTRRAAR